MEKKNQSIMEELEQAVAKWKESQQEQTSGYEYERSFVEMWQKMGSKIFQNSIGSSPASRNQKKTSNQFGKDRSAKKPRIDKGNR
jgi:hypothetical protein